MSEKRCFLNEDRVCPAEVSTRGHQFLCRAWSKDRQECVFILKATEMPVRDGDSTFTIFPESAPPPEVK